MPGIVYTMQTNQQTGIVINEVLLSFDKKGKLTKNLLIPDNIIFQSYILLHTYDYFFSSFFEGSFLCVQW